MLGACAPSVMELTGVGMGRERSAVSRARLAVWCVLLLGRVVVWCHALRPGYVFLCGSIVDLNSHILMQIIFDRLGV